MTVCEVFSLSLNWFSHLNAWLFLEMGDSALICLKAHVQHALERQGFHLRIRPETIERHAFKLDG